MSRFFPHLLLLGLLLSATAAAAQTPDADTVSMLAPGDKIKLEVWRREELSGEFTINADGTIRHPIYQKVAVVGVPIPVAEQRLREFLLLYEQEPQVSIEPLFRVIVTGEVNAPSVYEFGPEVTLGRAISLAGGVTQRGQLSRVSLVRNGVRSSLDMRRAEQSQLAIRSGDQIVVRRRLNPVQDILFPAGGILLAVHQLYSGARALFGF